MDSKQNTIKELTTQEATELLKHCLTAESFRSKLNLKDRRYGIELAVKLVKKNPFIKFGLFELELNYDRSSKNWFICFQSDDSLYIGKNYEYTGTREDSSIAFIWKVTEQLTKMLDK